MNPATETQSIYRRLLMKHFPKLFWLLCAASFVGLTGCKSNDRPTAGIADEKGSLIGNSTAGDKKKWYQAEDWYGRPVSIIPDW